MPSQAMRGRIGALQLAYYDEGKLTYAGRVGSGIGEAVNNDLLQRLRPLRISAPAADVPRTEQKGSIWVTPDLVAEVDFRGWTGDNLLRHASFKGLREDKAAIEVIRE